MTVHDAQLKKAACKKAFQTAAKVFADHPSAFRYAELERTMLMYQESANVLRDLVYASVEKKG